MAREFMEWSSEIQAQLDELDFHFGPYNLSWPPGTAQKQEQKWMKDLARCSVMPWQLAGAIGCWLLTTKGGILNTFSFWAMLLVIRCYKMARMLKKKGNEKKGYLIARRETYRLISLGYTPAWQVFFDNDLGNPAREYNPYDDEIRDEKQCAFENYRCLRRLNRTSEQGFNIDLNKKLNVTALRKYYCDLQDKYSDAFMQKCTLTEEDRIKKEAEFEKIKAEMERLKGGDVHEWET